MERTIEHGLAPPERMRALSGLDFLRAMVAGELPAPPIAETMGFGLVEVAPGRAVSRGRRIATAEARLTGPDGKLLAHGTSTLMILPPR